MFSPATLGFVWTLVNFLSTTALPNDRTFAYFLASEPLGLFNDKLESFLNCEGGKLFCQNFFFIFFLFDFFSLIDLFLSQQFLGYLHLPQKRIRHINGMTLALKIGGACEIIGY